MTELTLRTKDDIKIYANHYRGGFKEVLIICPGFMMCKDARPFAMLSERMSRDFDVITMDFRGHGKSKGLYTFTSRENNDLEAVIGYARPKYKFVGVIGFSLGAAVAINVTAINKTIDKIIAVSAPTEFSKIENRFLNKDIISSAIKKFHWNMCNTKIGNMLTNKPKPIENVDKISPIPVLFVHGGKDTIIEPRHSRELYNKAGGPKRLAIFDNCLHAEDVFLGDNFENFISLCIEWFKNKG